MIGNLFNTAVNMCKSRKRTWFGRLMDKEDTSTSMSSFIIFVILTVAVILLLLPAFALGIEAWFNHTVSSDINGWAAYIGAVCSLIVTVCGFKWGINNTDKKYPKPDSFDDDIDCRPPHAFGASEEEQINE